DFADSPSIQIKSAARETLEIKDAKKNERTNRGKVYGRIRSPENEVMNSTTPCYSILIQFELKHLISAPEHTHVHGAHSNFTTTCSGAT
ncbi:MAG: hypothetical protein WCT04_23745, partial [Planctomycetota bacterium]